VRPAAQHVRQAARIRLYNRAMLEVESVYEDGVLRPLQPLNVAEHERVLISIVKNASLPNRSALDEEYVRGSGEN